MQIIEKNPFIDKSFEMLLKPLPPSRAAIASAIIEKMSEQHIVWMKTVLKIVPKKVNALKIVLDLHLALDKLEADDSDPLFKECREIIKVALPLFSWNSAWKKLEKIEKEERLSYILSLASAAYRWYKIIPEKAAYRWCKIIPEKAIGPQGEPEYLKEKGALYPLIHFKGTQKQKEKIIEIAELIAERLTPAFEIRKNYLTLFSRRLSAIPLTKIGIVLECAKKYQHIFNSPSDFCLYVKFLQEQPIILIATLAKKIEEFFDCGGAEYVGLGIEALTLSSEHINLFNDFYLENPSTPLQPFFRFLSFWLENVPAVKEVKETNFHSLLLLLENFPDDFLLKLLYWVEQWRSEFFQKNILLCLSIYCSEPELLSKAEKFFRIDNFNSSPDALLLYFLEEEPLLESFSLFSLFFIEFEGEAPDLALFQQANRILYRRYGFLFDPEKFDDVKEECKKLENDLVFVSQIEKYLREILAEEIQSQKDLESFFLLDEENKVIGMSSFGVLILLAHADFVFTRDNLVAHLRA